LLCRPSPDLVVGRLAPPSILRPRPTMSGTWAAFIEEGWPHGGADVDLRYARSDDRKLRRAATGSVIWSSHVGTPVPATSLPCGDITPSVGITGTPVIDTAQSEIFVVGDMLVNGTSAHTLVGPNTTIGKIEMTQDVDPPSSDPAALLQRTGLTLDAGQVVFGMGGNYGDCSTYRGRVVAVNEAGETPSFFTVDAAAGDSQGAIWMGDAAGRVTRS